MKEVLTAPGWLGLQAAQWGLVRTGFYLSQHSLPSKAAYENNNSTMGGTQTALYTAQQGILFQLST